MPCREIENLSVFLLAFKPFSRAITKEPHRESHNEMIKSCDFNAFSFHCFSGIFRLSPVIAADISFHRLLCMCRQWFEMGNEIVIIASIIIKLWYCGCTIIVARLIRKIRWRFESRSGRQLAMVSIDWTKNVNISISFWNFYLNCTKLRLITGDIKLWLLS